MSKLIDLRPEEAGPLNVSQGGVCVVVVAHYASGTRLEIELRHPDSSHGVVAFGEVVYTILLPSHRDMYLTGCAFHSELPDEQVRPYT